MKLTTLGIDLAKYVFVQPESRMEALTTVSIALLPIYDMCNDSQSHCSKLTIESWMVDK